MQVTTGDGSVGGIGTLVAELKEQEEIVQGLLEKTTLTYVRSADGAKNRVELQKSISEINSLIAALPDLRPGSEKELIELQDHVTIIKALGQEIDGAEAKIVKNSKSLWHKFLVFIGAAKRPTHLATVFHDVLARGLQDQRIALLINEATKRGIEGTSKGNKVTLQYKQAGHSYTSDIVITDTGYGIKGKVFTSVQDVFARLGIVQKTPSGVKEPAVDMTTFLNACKADNLNQLNDLAKKLAKPSDICFADKEGNTLLHLVCKNGATKEVIAWLIDHGIAVNTQNQEGYTPLYFACGNRHIDIVQQLIENKAKVDQPTNEGTTPLHIACADGQTEIAKLLIANKADYNKATNGGLTPLHVAATKGYKDIVQLLIDKGAKLEQKNTDGQTPLELAEGNGHQECVTLLKTAISKNAKNIHDQFVKMCRNDDVEEVKKLIEEQYLNSTNQENAGTLLRSASELGAWKIVRWLIEKGVPVNARDAKNNTPLLLACRQDRTDVVRQLLTAQDIDPNQQNNEGWTPLHWACQYGFAEIVKLLIDKEAKLDLATNQSGSTPLHFACDKGFEKIAELLINKGANINQRNGKDKATALHLACDKGKIEVVRLLINKQADLNLAAMDDNATPLHLACEKNNVEIVRLLIEGGAKLDLKNLKELTPLEIAQNMGHKECVALLQKTTQTTTSGVDSTPPTDTQSSEQKSTIPLDVLRGFRKMCSKSDVDVSGVTKLISEGYLNAVEENTGRTLLHIAADEDNGAIAALLIEKGAVLEATDNEGSTPLHVAAYYGKTKAANELLTHKANLEAQDKGQRTPLHLASFSARAEVAALLVNNGAQLLARDKDELTPLHLAVYSEKTMEPERIAIVKMLISKGGKPCLEAQNEFGTPLHHASWKDDTGMIQALIDEGAYVHATNQDGRTPLHEAASQGSLESARLLVKANADIDAKDASGQTPLHTACTTSTSLTKDKRIQLIKWLISVGANSKIQNNDKLTPAKLTEDNDIKKLFQAE